MSRPLWITMAAALAAASLLLAAPVAPANPSGGDGIILRDGFEYTYVAPEMAPIPDQQLVVGQSLRVRAVGRSAQWDAQLSFDLPVAPPDAVLADPRVGLIAWTPTAPGSFNFVVRVDDRGLGSDSAAFVVNVLPAPPPPPRFVGIEDREIPALVPFALDLVIEYVGTPPTLVLLDGPEGLTLNGAALQWTPGIEQRGPHVVRVVAENAAGADSAAFTVTVLANQVPVARDDAYAVRVGQTLVVNASDGVLANDVDPEGVALSATLESPPAIGTLQPFNDDGSFVYSAPAGDPWPALDPAIVRRSRPASLQNPSSAAAAADLNNDGHVDVVMNGQNFETYAISGLDGSQLWSRQGCWFNASGSRVLADIDDSGSITSVAPGGQGAGGCSAGGTLEAIAADGQLKWLSPPLAKPLPDSVDAQGNPLPYVWNLGFGASPGVARLRPDAPPTILLRRLIRSVDGAYRHGPSNETRNAACRVATGEPNDEGQACRVTLLVDGSDGQVLDVLRAPNPTEASSAGVGAGWPALNHAPLAADLDGDGVVELVSGSDVWKQDAQGDWSLHWQTEQEPATLAVADLTGDGRAEVVHVVSHWTGASGTVSGLYIYRHDGSLLRRIPYFRTAMNHLTLADLDGDARAEILAAGDGVLEAIRIDGSRMWVYVIPEAERPANFPNPPPAGIAPLSPSLRGSRILASNHFAYDLDGDGQVEVVAKSRNQVEIVNGRTGQPIARLHTFSNTAGDLTNNAHQVMLLDVDGDGSAELVSTHSVMCVDPDWCGNVMKIEGARPWLPGPRIWHQVNYQPTQIEDDGTVLHDPTVPTSFRNPIQQGTPLPPQAARTTRFAYRASDGGAVSEPATVMIRIDPDNRPPVFVSRPPTAIRMTLDDFWLVQFQAVDPEGGPVTYRLLEPDPSIWFEIESSTGLLRLRRTNYGEGQMMHFAIEARDALGAVATQGFTVRFTNIAATVPDVQGQALPAALAALAAEQLDGFERAAIHHPSPAGTVIGQDPLPGATGVPIRAEVALTLSLGPEPIDVPNVVGLGEAAAGVLLGASGFDLQPAQRVFDPHRPRGEVLAQDPPAGTRTVPGSARLTVSAGIGLALELSSTVGTANRPIDVRLKATNVDGQDVPPPVVSWTVVPASSEFTGTLPVVVGGQLQFAADTRGAYTVIATDAATQRSVSARFAVHHAEPQGQISNAGEFRRYEEMLDRIDALLRDLEVARDANDVPEMRAILADMLVEWRSFDVLQVYGSAPVAPDNGFPLDAGALRARGMTPTAADVAYKQILQEAAADARALLDAWHDPSSTMEELSALDRRLHSRTAQLAGLQPGVYGLVDGIPELHVLLAARLPRTLDQIFNEIELLLLGRSGLFLPAGRSTLPEQLTVIAVNKILESMGGEYQRFKSEVFHYAGWTTAIVAITQTVRENVDAGSAEAVVSGPSLSIRVFEAPWAMIEGPYEAGYFDLNEVLIIGPNIVVALEGVIENWKKGFEYFQNLDPNEHFGNFDDAKRRYREIKQTMIDNFQSPVEDLVREAQAMYQPAQGSEFSCVFQTGPCTQLLYPNGFASVYSMAPDAYIALPAPIVVLVMNPVTGAATLDLVSFLPTERAD